MSERQSIRFHEDFVDKILGGEKRTTWRVDGYGWAESGETVDLHDSEGKLFGVADIQWVKSTKIKYLTQEDKKHHGSYDSDEEVIDALVEHYPEKQITPDTGVTVIRFMVKQSYREKYDG